MSSPHHLSWENFRSTVFLRGQQRVHRVTDSPYIEVFGDGIENRIGIWLEVAADTAIPSEMSKLAFITSRTLNQKGRVLLEVATTTTSLHRQFYHFAVAVAERVIVERCAPIEAVGLELQCFSDLLEEKSLLGTERQLGLLGELIFLERLVGKGGIGALDSWLGPMGEPHDFRLQAFEFEVKTTVSPHRIHTIHGTEQLVPSKGCSLYLISVLLGPAGAGDGFSLVDKIAQLSGQFAPVPVRLSQFTTALQACAFRDADRGHYTRQFAMRRPLGLVRVDNNFPALTRPTIQSALGPLALRIESLQYDVSVEGLEYEDGTVEFDAVIPG
jgi:hypothetical protein